MLEAFALNLGFASSMGMWMHRALLLEERVGNGVDGL